MGMQCSKQILTTGLNFNRMKQCKNHAVEGTEFCNAHQPGKVKAERDPGKERYKEEELMKFPKVTITVEDRKGRFEYHTLGAIYGIKLIESLPSEFLFKAMDLDWKSPEFTQLSDQIGKGTNPSWVTSACAFALYKRGEIDEQRLDWVNR